MASQKGVFKCKIYNRLWRCTVHTHTTHTLITCWNNILEILISIKYIIDITFFKKKNFYVVIRKLVTCGLLLHSTKVLNIRSLLEIRWTSTIFSSAFVDLFFRLLQDYHSFQPCSDRGSLCRLFNSVVPAHRRKGQTYRRYIIWHFLTQWWDFMIVNVSILKSWLPK